MPHAIDTAHAVPLLPTGRPQNSLQLGAMQGHVWRKRSGVRISEELLRTHLAIFGGTRFGKSKLFERICRELVELGRGFAFVDPHSDTADDLLAYLAARYEHLGFLRNNIHYLNPNERLFSFDPFRYDSDPDDPEGDSNFRYASWLHTKIKDMVNIIVRQQGETEDEKQKMVRLKRWLYNALYAVGVRQDDDGVHLTLTDAFALLNPADPQHDELYERVESHLSREVRADFEKLRSTRDARKQEDWVESTFNRLRDILSPIVQRIFNLEAPSIDFREIVSRGGVILASLGKTPYFHEDEALAIAGLLIREISEAARTAKRDGRRPYGLFIDEAQHFLGEDLLRILKESAKYKLALGLAVQGLDNLQKGEMDLVPAVLGQCGIRITFRQQYAEHAEILAKSLCYPMLDFTELVHEVDRDGGYRWVVVESETQGASTGTSLEVGRSRSHSEGTALQSGTSHSESQSTGRSETSAIGRTEERSAGISQHASHTHPPTETRSAGQSHAQSLSHGTSTNHGASHGTTQSSSVSQSQSDTQGSSLSRGINQSTSRSVTRQPTPLHVTWVEEQKTGRLERAVNDQFAAFAATISSLPKQHCLMAIAAYNRAFVLRVDDVLDPFEARLVSPAWRTRAIEELKARIFFTHSYYFAASDPPPVRHHPSANGSTHAKLLPSGNGHSHGSPFPG